MFSKELEAKLNELAMLGQIWQQHNERAMKEEGIWEDYIEVTNKGNEE